MNGSLCTQSLNGGLCEGRWERAKGATGGRNGWVPREQEGRKDPVRIHDCRSPPFHLLAGSRPPSRALSLADGISGVPQLCQELSSALSLHELILHQDNYA